MAIPRDEFGFMKIDEPSRTPEPEKRSISATPRALYCKARATVLAEPKIIDGFSVTAGALIVLWWLA